MKLDTFFSKSSSLLSAPLLWCVILIGLSAPISTAFDNVLMALVMLGALFSMGKVSHIAISHPVARAAIMLFSILLVGVFYGATPIRVAVETLLKYIDLAFVPVFIFLLANETARRRARYAFLCAMAITLFLSYLIGLGIVPLQPWMHPWTVQANPAIFHSHITQNNLMAFAIFLSLLEWREATSLAKQFAWAAFALLATFNVLFMVLGRTGYLMLFVLLGWFGWQTLARYMQRRGKHLGWQHGVILLGGFVLLFFVAFHTSDRLHERLVKVLTEYQVWVPNQGLQSSTGERLDYYLNTFKIVAEHPVAGIGTGGFPAAFAQQVEGTAVIHTNNPHNEYLLIATQTGLAGLALMLFLFYTHWRIAPLLPTALEQDAARGLLLAYVINCMLNSALLDHVDGLFFSFMTATLFAGLRREERNG